MLTAASIPGVFLCYSAFTLDPFYFQLELSQFGAVDVLLQRGVDIATPTVLLSKS
jgi:hypothetical protein